MWHGCWGMACQRFPIEKDQRTNMTKFTSCASHWGTVIEVLKLQSSKMWEKNFYCASWLVWSLSAAQLFSLVLIPRFKSKCDVVITTNTGWVISEFRKTFSRKETHEKNVFATGECDVPVTLMSHAVTHQDVETLIWCFPQHHFEGVYTICCCWTMLHAELRGRNPSG